jgi:hypothetical protein
VGRRLGINWPLHNGDYRSGRPSVRNETRALSLMPALRVKSGTAGRLRCMRGAEIGGQLIDSPREALKESPNPTERRGAYRDEIQSFESSNSHNLFRGETILSQRFCCLCLKDCLAQRHNFLIANRERLLWLKDTFGLGGWSGFQGVPPAIPFACKCLNSSAWAAIM